MDAQKLLGVPTNVWIIIPFILILATLIQSKMDSVPIEPGRVPVEPDHMTGQEIDALLERGYGSPEEVFRMMNQINRDMKESIEAMERTLKEHDGKKINKVDREAKLEE